MEGRARLPEHGAGTPSATNAEVSGVQRSSHPRLQGPPSPSGTLLPLVVPQDEIARQATAALQGYAYQLYQTVGAWLTLRPEQVLYVELAEDFAVSDDGTIELRQVKHSKAPLNLRSEAVSSLISALWKFQNANPGRDVVAALITTGKIGKEKGLTFPEKVAGLSYWRVAARDQADVEPMRSALLGLKLPADLKGFIERATPQEIRDRILRPIRWFGAGPSQDDIERDLHERLVYFGNARGVGAQDSKNALSALIVELLACIGRSPESRYVTTSDLLTIFQKNTYRLVPPSQIIFPALGQGTSLSDPNSVAHEANSMPLPPRASLRLVLVNDLHRALVERGILWLHGSSGLGKTTLALLLARRQNSAWRFADLRNLDPHALRFALTRLSADFEASGARGLILDDLPAATDNTTIFAIKRIVRAVANADGVVVVTSTKPPPPTLASGLNLSNGAISAVPYLTENDVHEIVSQAGGDPRIWGRIVFMFCGGGHPQLVDARIMGLRQRGWPTEERLSDLTPFKARSGDLDAERESVRTRLLRELDDKSRELLLRLSLLTSNFDRSIMFAIAGAPDGISQAGILFDALVGPWIEQVGPGHYRLSPLLRDSGEAGLAEIQRNTVRTAVIEHLLERRPFPAEQLNQLFIFAFALKHTLALNWFWRALLQAAMRDEDLFKRLAEEVSVFAMADLGERKPLFADDIKTSVMLRYAQLRVAIASGHGKLAAKILDRALVEIEQLSGEFKLHTLSLVLGTALAERSVPLAPKRWFGMLQTFTSIPHIRRMLRRKLSSFDPHDGLVTSVSNDEMLFIVRATALNGLDQLCELVEVLDALSHTLRDRYLAASSRHFQSVHHIVASAWLSAVREKGFDGIAAAATLARLSEIASCWKNQDAAIELACAQAVMLDDYANDMAGALNALESAQAKYPQSYRINRQRQRVYYRNGDHARALAEFERFADAFPAMSPVDRAFSLREAGRSAAEIGELDKARLFFGQAWESAIKCGDHMRPMVAGLSADCAILDFQAERIDSALTLMTRALTEAESIDPKAGLKEHYCVLVLLTAILWMRGGAADWPLERHAMLIGMCSNPDPPPEVKDRPLPDRLLSWYQLSELEAEISDGRVVLSALRQRTTEKGGLLPLEAMLSSSLLQAAVRTLSVDRFLDALPTYARAVVSANTPNQVRFDAFSITAGFLKPVSPSEWNEPQIKEVITGAVLGFSIVAICSERHDTFNELRTRLLQSESLGSAVAPLFDEIAAPSDKPTTLIFAVADTLGHMLQPNFVFNAGEAFLATVRLAQLLSNHLIGETLAVPVVAYFSKIWREILTDRTFSVRSPVTNGPLILAAVSKGETARARLANLVLATHAAVRERLSDELRTLICQMRQVKRKPLNELPEITTHEQSSAA